MNHIRAGFCVLLIFILLTCVGCNGNIAKMAKAVTSGETLRNVLKFGAYAENRYNSSKNSHSSNSSLKFDSGKIGAATGIGVAAATEVKAKPSPKEEAATVLAGYYKAIADKRMSDAYNALSYEMQNQLGTYESFSSSYATTVYNDVSNINVVYEALNEIRLAYVLKSTDNVNGRMSVQVFLGEATLSKIDGRWLITDFMVKLAK